MKAGAELMSSAPWYAAFQKVPLGPEVASSSAGVQPMLMTVEIAMKRLQDIYIYIYTCVLWNRTLCNFSRTSQQIIQHATNLPLARCFLAVRRGTTAVHVPRRRFDQHLATCYHSLPATVLPLRAPRWQLSKHARWSLTWKRWRLCFSLKLKWSVSHK